MKTIKILGYDYKLSYSPPLESGGMESAGRCETGLQLIHIDPKQSDSGQKSSILHEIIEALNYHLELELPHKTISQLEAGLHQVMQDNPDLFTKGVK